MQKIPMSKLEKAEFSCDTSTESTRDIEPEETTEAVYQHIKEIEDGKVEEMEFVSLEDVQRSI